ncbi:cadmium-translocating P-type ATPase [Pedobacter sp. HMF7647]|uniref:P-type Cu(+) transporter n=1 Tax=Hufsiella arboris TaxID=2695275 RepID=A0A7K1Y9S7_9SPHI|nr:heavy metal translocating P-type ATPase [Hufsiella arboris]MXV51324.1 cadmium-translocating P-type ATPase [Hufsiella arboris]
MHSVKQTFPVTGMSCASCATSVESMLKNTIGVTDAGVNFANQTAWASYDEDKTSLSKLQQAVQSIGYDLIVDEEDPAAKQLELQENAYKQLKRQTVWAAILTLPVFILGMFFMEMPYTSWISLIFTAPVLFIFGKPFFINGWKQAKHGKANMDTLVALSTGIAFLFSVFNTVYPEYWHKQGLHAHVYYEAAAVIIVFISLGKLLEEKAKANTSSAIKKLIGLQPKTVTVIVGGGEQEVPVSAIQPGDLIQVKPGEKIAVDGKIVNGSSYVDESMITGEPVAVDKQAGDAIFSGTINQRGSFTMKAEKVGGKTVLAHIIKLVQEAQGSKAPVQKLVDKIAGIFVPVIILIAILTFAAWMFFDPGNGVTHGLLTSVSVLVIACPCALGLATPTAIMVGIGKGAEDHMLIKDAESLETAHKVTALVLDKTGTITEGKPAVSEIAWLDEADRTLHEQILYSMQLRSEHPLAAAVVESLKAKNTQKLIVGNFENITGRGIKAVCEGKNYLVGNAKLLEENGINPDDALKTKAIEHQLNAETVSFFAEDKRILALIAMTDKIKPSSKAAIQQLKRQGVEVFMLTGDNESTAKAIAQQAGIDQFKAQTSPEQKAAFIKELQKKGKVVAMVGDGINDSPALSAADVSIAMGQGSDIALDVAKITLITSDLALIPKVLDLSRRTVRTIRQNLFWAFIYNLIGIPIAAGLLYPFNGFLLNPMIAGAAMAFSSVSVVLNSLRLKYTN